MASKVRFTEKAIGVYGATQTVRGTPANVSSANALAALTVTFNPNVTSTEEQYMGQITQREALVAITDVFADVQISTPVPRLGTVFGRPIQGRETAILTINEAISTGTLIFAGATMTISSLASRRQIAEELLAYLSGGSATQPHSTFAGVVNTNFAYELNSENGYQILATAYTANTNVTSITLGGTQAAKASLEVNDQTNSPTSVLPIIPFMEASRFRVIIRESLSISEALYDLYNNSDMQLQKAITEANWSLNNLVNAKRAADKLDILDLGTSGNAATTALVANIVAAQASLTTLVNKARLVSELIASLKYNLGVNVGNDLTGAALVADLIPDDAAVFAAITGIDGTTVNTLLDVAAYVDTITNTNAAVEEQFIALRDRCKDFYIQAEEKAALLPALTDTGTTTALTYLTTAHGVVQTPITTASLTPVVREVEFNNKFVSPEVMTLHIRKSSMQMAGMQKVIIVSDAVANTDLTIEVGQRPKLDFKFTGNIYDTVNLSELTYQIKQQKTDAAYPTQADNVRNASLQATDSGLILNNVCIAKIVATNIDGYSHTRVKTGCEDTWDDTPVVSTVTITILEPEADTNIIDQFNTEDSLGKSFWLSYKQDGTSGNTLLVELTGLILKSYKSTAVNNRAAFDLEFTMEGYSTIVLA